MHSGSRFAAQHLGATVTRNLAAIFMLSWPTQHSLLLKEHSSREEELANWQQICTTFVRSSIDHATELMTFDKTFLSRLSDLDYF